MYCTGNTICRYGSRLIEEGKTSLQSMLTVVYAILLCAIGIGDAQMAFPLVARGGKAVQRLFEGPNSRRSTPGCTRRLDSPWFAITVLTCGVYLCTIIPRICCNFAFAPGCIASRVTDYAKSTSIPRADDPKDIPEYDKLRTAPGTLLASACLADHVASSAPFLPVSWVVPLHPRHYFSRTLAVYCAFLGYSQCTPNDIERYRRLFCIYDSQIVGRRDACKR